MKKTLDNIEDVASFLGPYRETKRKKAVWPCKTIPHPWIVIVSMDTTDTLTE